MDVFCENPSLKRPLLLTKMFSNPCVSTLGPRWIAANRLCLALMWKPSTTKKLQECQISAVLFSLGMKRKRKKAPRILGYQLKSVSRHFYQLPQLSRLESSQIFSFCGIVSVRIHGCFCFFSSLLRGFPWLLFRDFFMRFFGGVASEGLYTGPNVIQPPPPP